MRCSLFVALVMAGFITRFGHAEDWVYPLDAAVREDGSILIADRHLPGIWTLKEGELTPFVKGSKQFRTPLNAVRCICVTSGGVVLAGDSATREVYRVAADGMLTPLTNGKIGIPTQLASSGETVYATDLELQRVWKFPLAGGEPEEVAVVAGPRGVAVDVQNRVWILSPQQPQLIRISTDGTREMIVDEPVFNFPNQVVVDAQGQAYVSDGYEKTIWRIADGGAPEKWIGGAPLVNPVGLCLDGDRLLIVDPRTPGLFAANKEGGLTRLYPAE